MSAGEQQYSIFDDETRRKIFWLLKRLTSYSLWQKKLDAWQIFSAAYEEAVKNWPADQPEQMSAKNLARIFHISTCYIDGLEKLKKGDRSVWRKGQDFQIALKEYYVVSSFLYTDGNYWERGRQEAPYPPKVELLNKLMRASEYHGEHSANEVRYDYDTWATWMSPKLLLSPDRYKYSFYELAFPQFPKQLPEVPTGTDTYIVSGQIIPCDGIWEPVKIEIERFLVILPAGKKITPENKCFNYLVQGTKAPNLLAETTDENGEHHGRIIFWHLVWEDTRYRDGIIPDESEYFL